MDMQTPGRSNNIVIPVAVAAMVVIGIIGYYLYSSNSATAPTASTIPSATTTTITTISASAEPSVAATAGAYEDGAYEATGNYVSPGGPREVKVTITIADGKISDSTFEGSATDPASKRFQGEFSQGYKTMIVGKSLDEVNLTKVSGSSLTPKGFMDALTKIKADAQG